MAQRSKFGRKLAILVASTAILASPLATVAVAAENGKVAAQAEAAKADPTYATQKEFLKASDDGLAVLKQVHEARAALYDGKSDEAAKLLDAAASSMSTAKGDMQKLLVADTKSGSDDPVLLPVDVQISYGENFVPTDDLQQALSDAGDQIKANQPDQALETLRMASLDMQVVAAMMPMDQAATHLADAQKALSSGDASGAQVALAALEESVTVQGWTIDAIPRQGDGSTQQSSAADSVGGMQSATQGQAAAPASAG